MSSPPQRADMNQRLKSKWLLLVVRSARSFSPGTQHLLTALGTVLALHERIRADPHADGASVTMPAPPHVHSSRTDATTHHHSPEYNLSLLLPELGLARECPEVWLWLSVAIGCVCDVLAVLVETSKHSRREISPTRRRPHSNFPGTNERVEWSRRGRWGALWRVSGVLWRE